MLSFRIALAAGTAATVCALSTVAFAQSSFPTKPIVIVIPYAPGGGTETETRMYAQKIAQNEGYKIVVENRPGAAGTIGAAYVSRAAPDGHTIMQSILGIILSPMSYPNLTFDPVKDFSPIALMSKRPLILYVHPSLPVKTVAEYMAYAKANPGKINYGTGGLGGSTHIPGAWLHHATKTKVTFVHYKSIGAMLPDLYAGRLQASASTPSNPIRAMKEGKVRGLGVTSKERIAIMPDLPSITETIPEYDFSSWMGISGPKGIPPAIVNKLNRDFVKALNDPAIKDKLIKTAIIPVGSTPDEFGKIMAKESEHWTKFVKESGIKLSGS